jgi:hypothetical protein
MDIIEKLMSDDGSIVCHYTSRETVIEHILPSKQIRFSPLSNTNDPKESKERLMSVTGSIENLDESKPDFGPIINKLKKMALDYSKVLCLTKSADKNPHNLNTKRAFGRPRMWSQYANNHEGIALVFDKDKLGDEINSTYKDNSKFLLSGDVEYNDYLKSLSLSASIFNYDKAKRVGLENALLEHFRNYKNALYFRKDSDWSGEDEWRYIIHKWETGYEFIDISSSLEAIILGVDFPKFYLPTVKHLSKDFETKILNLHWDSTNEDFFLRKVQST